MPLLHVLKTGCQWRQLPHDFPYWKTVYTRFRRLSIKGKSEDIYKDLVGKERCTQGQSTDLAFAVADSQSVKTTDAAHERGFDGKK